MDLNKLTVPELMSLQVQVNTLVESLKTRAKENITLGGSDKYFALHEGTPRRVVVNQVALTAELSKHFEAEVINVTKPIAMGASEKLLKEVMEKEELEVFMGSCTEPKLPEPKLVYIGDIDG